MEVELISPNTPAHASVHFTTGHFQTRPPVVIDQNLSATPKTSYIHLRIAKVGKRMHHKSTADLFSEYFCRGLGAARFLLTRFDNPPFLDAPFPAKGS